MEMEDNQPLEPHQMAMDENDAEEITVVRTANKNPFITDNDDDDDDDESDSNISVHESSDAVSMLDPNPQSVNSEFTTSLCQSEADSLDAKISMSDGDTLVASMMASSIDVLDNSDIEIIKEERGSADSIEILESSMSSTSVKMADGTPILDSKMDFCTDSNFDSERLASESSFYSHFNQTDFSASQDAGDTVTLKSNSSSACGGPPDNTLSHPDTPVSNTSDSSHSGAQPDVRYSKLQESYPSSYAPSPFDSPTHAVQSFAQNQSTPSGDPEFSRPDSLSLLPKSLPVCDRQRFSKKESYSSLSEYSSRSGSMDALIEAATSTPLHTQGTVSVEGEMITFVAHGINELIKKSRENPVAGWGNEVTPRSRSSSSISSTTSGWSASVASRATRSPSSVYTQSPDDIPPIDPKALCDVEMHARKMAESLNTLMQGLVVRLHQMSSSTNDCLNVYKEAVDKTCDSVDANIKAMYALMAKCEELSRAVKPLYRIQDQIKEIKRLLDLFESQLSDPE